MDSLQTVVCRLPADRGLSTIIRSTSSRLQAPGMIADNQIKNQISIVEDRMVILEGITRV